MKKTIALTLLSLASVFALSTTAIKAEENGETGETTEVQETERKMGTTSEVQVDGSVLEFRGVSGSLEFDELTIDGDSKTASAKGNLNLTVADLRGTRKGWTVTAKHEGLKTQVNEKDEFLDGSTITLGNGTLSNTIDSQTNNPSFASNNVISTTENNISIADSGEGMGLWSHTWGDVKLIIPAIQARDMYEGKYSTTITWTLAATPKAETPTAE